MKKHISYIILTGAILLSLSFGFQVNAQSLSTITMDKPIKEMTISELQAKIAEILQAIQQLQVLIAQLTGTTDISGIPSSYAFNTSLSYGASSLEVKYLQIFLNQDPATRVSSTGYGSPGQETTYYGAKTRQAIIKFQLKYKTDISSITGYTIAGTGYLGPGTRQKMNQVLQGYRGGSPYVPPGDGTSEDKAGTYCGDKIAQRPSDQLIIEDCDGTDLRNKTCISQGYTGGTLSCNTDCSFNTSQCLGTGPGGGGGTPTPTPPTPGPSTSCGDNIIQSPNTSGVNEVCDATSLNNQTCVTKGYTGGTLSCSSNCLTFNTTNCTSPTPPVNNAPVLNTIGNKSIDENSLLSFTVSGSDLDGDTLYYSIIDSPSGASFNSSTRTFTWTPTYEQSGNYNVTFIVSDAEYIDQETITITVNDVATGSVCGDSICDGTETCSTCSADCGACPVGNTYYLDAVNGDDGNPGTSELPWKTLIKTQSVVQGGDIVILKNGSYGAYSEASINRSNWITYKAADGHNPEFIGIGINWNGPTSDTYLKFDGITIRLDDGSALSVRYSRYTQFLNLNVIGQGARYSTRGFNVRYSSHITIDNSTFSGGAKQGRYDGFDSVLYFRDTDNITITNNEIRQFKGYGIILPINNVIISNNNIHNFGGDGIYFSSGTGPLLIENNKIHDLNLYIAELQETTTETIWNLDGTVMSNLNAVWNTLGDTLVSPGMEVHVLSGTNALIGDGEQHGGNFAILSVSPDGTQITLSRGIADGGQPSNVDYYLKSSTHADLIQAGAGSGTQFPDVTIRGNELYDNLGGWAFMHIQPANWDNPDMNIGGSNWLVENNLMWNFYEDGGDEYGHPINLRHIDGLVFRNNTVIGRVQVRANKNVTFSNNIIGYIQVYDNAGLIENDYNIINRGTFEGNYLAGEHTTFLYPGRNWDKWNDPAFTSIFVDYYGGNFSPVMDNYACNGSVNLIGVAVGALPCV